MEGEEEEVAMEQVKGGEELVTMQILNHWLGRALMKKIKSKVEMEIDEEDKRGGVERKGRAVPSFSHFEPCVQKKGERKKLLGFECKQCEEYYKSKLEEGLTQDQILQMINNSSRHQGLCKPPLTLQDFGIL